MSNFKDTLQTAIDNGILLDYCGSAERMKYNGLYTDLCGMPLEEYTKPYCPCNGGGGNNDDNPTKGNLVLTLSYADNGDGTFSPVVKADKTVLNDALLNIVIDGKNLNLTIAKGETSAKSSETFKEKIPATSFKVGNETELLDYYNKITTIDSTMEKESEYIYSAYINQKDASQIASINSYDFEISTANSFEISDNEIAVDFIIPSYTSEEPVDDDEYNNWLLENAYGLLLYTPSDFEIEDIKLGSGSAKEFFTKIGEKTIGENVYYIWGKIITEDEKNAGESIITVNNTFELRGYVAEESAYNFTYTILKK